ncbi:FMN-binding protein, partial [Fusobacterium sp. PH5-44]|uniref:FMN-binding protein n=1 Tax=unclassified Fusobacterium TaxID=2648384 RepID=UPI003D1C58EC
MKKSLSIMIIIGALIVGLFHFMDNNPSSKLFNVGKHIGEAQGYNGPIKVEVTTSQDKIEHISILEHSDTTGICDLAFKEIPENIIKHQSVAVDAVSGATASSKGIKYAVTNALESAGADIVKISAPIKTDKADSVKVTESNKDEVKSKEAQKDEVKEANTSNVDATKKEGALFPVGTFSGE